jgi:hypothetical protein
MYAVWKQPRRFRAGIAVAAVLLLFSAFWSVRTYLLTGNPFFPESVSRATHMAITAPQHSNDGKLARYVKLPWTITFDGPNTFESPLGSPAGIILFAFFPLIFFVIPRWRNKTILACIGFSAIYFIYWASVLSMLRYAILPIAIAAMLLAKAAVHFYDAWESKAIRFSVAALEVYCLIIAMLAVMIIEVNGPQIAYLAGRLDKPGYLGSVLRTYRSLEYLQKAEPGAEILGIDNCTRAYAPNPLKFQCVLCPQKGCETSDVKANLEKFRPQYIVIPEAGQLSPELAAIRVYRDEYFAIYKVP